MLKSVTLLAILISSVAHAETIRSQDWRDEVLNHPVVTAVHQLMNASHANTCAAPKLDDLKVFCTGALPPVTEPTVVNSPCFFNLSLNCEGASAIISGEKQLYILLTPDRRPQMNSSVIVIKNVELK